MSLLCMTKVSFMVVIQKGEPTACMYHHSSRLSSLATIRVHYIAKFRGSLALPEISSFLFCVVLSLIGLPA